jgi:nucleotide-binding universal stress UspA family protein
MIYHILHPTDLSESHFKLCEEAAWIAKKFKATLHLLHVIEPSMSYQWAQGLGFAELSAPLKDNATAVLATVGEACGVSLEHQYVEVGSIKTVILNKILDLGCELAIIGRHSPEHFALLGSNALAIVKEANCHVLTLAIKP